MLVNVRAFLEWLSGGGGIGVRVHMCAHMRGRITVTMQR